MRSSPRNPPHGRLGAFLDPLEEHWQFIEVESKGRKSGVSLTGQGKSMYRIFGSGS
jgi:hypothetical protein